MAIREVPEWGASTVTTERPLIGILIVAHVYCTAGDFSTTTRVPYEVMREITVVQGGRIIRHEEIQPTGDEIEALRVREWEQIKSQSMAEHVCTNGGTLVFS